ncbi:phosphotransferase enzyme family protein [Paenibacillus guangzhouensis]|uniref:phosphotransferase enzyme family protein n=1 Tax=Paenibacillus guangzhouensis TaxID=1473112 RepID=UPI00126691B3|nr:phosphotransferase [Paenibacillus guangzhouensis]
MIPAIKEQFSEEIVKEASKRYSINADTIRSIGGFESLVYEYEKNNKSYILKITHTIRRMKNYILGELDFLHYLSNEGLNVARAIPSTLGNLIEEVPSEEGSFLAISYEKAPGNVVSNETWNESLYEKWGEFLGKIHHLTKNYELSNPAFKRQTWEQEEQLKAAKYLRFDDEVIPLLEKRLNKLTSLPKSKDTYGLTHTDFHHDNFHLHHGEIHLFDFDDCGYTYFVNDIGIIFYYALGYPPRNMEDKIDYYKLFFRYFMNGYLKENTITEEELIYLQDFIKLRHTLLYISFHQTDDVTNLNEEQMKMLKEHQREITSDEPMIPIDFVQEFRKLCLNRP